MKPTPTLERALGAFDTEQRAAWITFCADTADAFRDEDVPELAGVWSALGELTGGTKSPAEVAALLRALDPGLKLLMHGHLDAAATRAKANGRRTVVVDLFAAIAAAAWEAL